MPDEIHPHDRGMGEAANVVVEAPGLAGGGDSTRAARRGQDEFLGEVEIRQQTGYLAAFLAVVGVIWFVLHSLAELDELPVPTNEYGRDFAMARLAAHAAISLGLIFFFYQMLRAAERFLIPYSWTRNPLLVSLMLGFKLPVSVVRRLAVRALRASRGE